MPRKGQTVKDHPLVVGESKTQKGYTVFKNTDEELVKKIKNIKADMPKDTWVESGHWHGTTGECRKEKKLNDKQFLCVDSVGHYFIKNADDFKDTTKENILEKINKEFNAAEVLNNSLSPMFTKDGFASVKFERYDTYYSKRWPDYEENKEKIEERMTYDEMGRINAVESGVHFSSWDGLILIESDNIGGSSMFCYINEDGNVENRDHNYDIKDVIGNKEKTKKDLIDLILPNIPEGNYENYGNKWFTSSKCFILNKVEEGETVRPGYGNKEGNPVFDITVLESQGNGKYGGRWKRNVTKPKSSKPSSRDHLLSKILPLINELEWRKDEVIDMNEYIDYSKIPGEEAPKKRVQKTKINEDDFSDVFDWSGENIDEFREDFDIDGLIKATKSLSNGIVGDNDDTIKGTVRYMLGEWGLPSFSFNKGEEAPDHSDYKALVKLPNGINLTFEVAEGDACEITNSHSIYYTDIVNLEIVE